MNLENLYKILEKVWSKETCFEEMQDSWVQSNPAYGQCYVTALIVNDFFGGDILKAKLVDGISHYWNLVDGEEIDFTKSQFNSKEIIPIPGKVVREDLDENKRYLLLKSKVEEICDIASPAHLAHKIYIKDKYRD